MEAPVPKWQETPDWCAATGLPTFSFVFLCSPALSQAGSVLAPVKCTLESHSTQSCNGRRGGGSCGNCFEELILLEVPVKEETSKPKSRGKWCWVRTSSWGRVSAEQRDTRGYGPGSTLVSHCS